MKKILLTFGISLIFVFFSSCGLENGNVPDNNIVTEVGNNQVEETLEEFSLPSPTPEPEAMETQLNISEAIIPDASKLITLTELGGGVIRHVDLETGEVLDISITPQVSKQVLGYFDDCTLILRSGNQIIRTTLTGETSTEIFSIDHSDDEFLYKVSVSPLKSYIAYTLGQGYLDYDRFEIQDIYILGKTSAVIKVTENGGGWVGEWSNDESLLAYSDYDGNGIQQLFVYDLKDDTRRQLTTFQGEEIEIRRIRWSGDNKQILFEIVSDNNQNAIILTDVLEPQTNYVEISGFSETRGFWWKDNQEIVLHAKTAGESGEWGLFLVIAKSSAIVSQVLESQYGNQPFILANPLGSPELVGFFLENGFYVYDFDSKEMHKYVNVQKGMDLLEWIPASSIESSLDFCEEVP